MHHTKTINLLLVISAINLTLMVPGGFIESRDFSHISPTILAGFNIFLTTLGIISLFLVYFITNKQKWAAKTALICGLSYFFVYTLDLLGIFPKTPSAMPLLLLILEVLGTILAIPLMYYASLRANMASDQEKATINKRIYGLIGLASLLGIGIIIFATKSAMLGE